MTYRIERLGQRGDGIADGPIYVDRTLPGELVDGELDGDRVIQARILEPSDHRVRPACTVYKSCGGCGLQHASDTFVADWKVARVEQALAGIGTSIKVRNLHTSPANSRRRAKLTAQRVKSGIMIGFNGRGSHTLQRAESCKILTTGILAAWPVFEAIGLQCASRKGTIAFWVLETDTGLDVSVEGSKPMTPETIAALGVATEGVVSRLTVDGETVAKHCDPVLTFGSTAVVPPPQAFAQATLSAERVLQMAVAEALSGTRKVADLFCGMGTFGLALAGESSVHGFDSERELIQAAQDAVRGGTGLKPASFQVRNLFKEPLDAAELNGFDGIVMDPPRAGARSQVQQVAQSKIKRVAMVSCDLGTFMRDVAILVEQGFQIDWVDVIDQFRWTAHIELAAQLSR